MAFDPANIKSELPELAWRGIVVPARSASFKFAHIQARRPYPYLNVVAHEPVRRDSKVITTVLLFLNTLEADLYPDRFREWIAASEDKSAGDFYHPAIGYLRAVVLDVSVEVDEQTRAGVIVTATFEEDRADASTPPAETDVPPDAKEVARSADVQYEFVRALYPTDETAPLGTDPAIVAVGNALEANYTAAFANAKLQYPTGGGPQTFVELFDAILGDALSDFIWLSGRFAQAAGVVEKVSDAVELIQDPLLWPATLALRETFRAFTGLAEKYGQGERPIAQYVAPREMPLDEVADATGANQDDLVSLNPNLLLTPWIPRGSAVKYYTS
jgi:hypothetical protein